MDAGFTKRRKDLKATYKTRKEWWSRVFASPVAHYALCLIGDLKFITPNRLTIGSFLLTIGVALLVLSESELRLAAVLLQVAYVLDCMDGQLARYRSTTSNLGSFLDKSLDFVKFSFLVFSLTMNAYSQDKTSMTLAIGFLCLFLTCFLPYLKSMLSADFGIGSWNILSGESFVQRNMRFFLFEEAQWYLLISVCLLFGQIEWALWILCFTQSLLAIAQMGRAISILKKQSTRRLTP